MKLFSRIWFGVVAMLISLLIGTVGFIISEDYSVLHAFYMAVITFSTVGYGEVAPLSEGGQLFTSFYIIFNIGVYAYVISVFSAYLVEGELRKALRNFLIGREMKKMKDHVIICGFGRNGVKAAEVLFAEDRKFVVVERDLETINTHSDNSRYQFIQADATLDESLIDAGIEKASTIITTLPRDSDNVFITLTAKQLNPSINVIARASESNAETKLTRAGADNVVMPDSLGGAYMAQLILKPTVIEFLEMLNGLGERDMLLEEISYDILKPEFRETTIAEMNARAQKGINIIAVKEGGKYHFNPEPTQIISEGTVAILLGHHSRIQEFKSSICD